MKFKPLKEMTFEERKEFDDYCAKMDLLDVHDCLESMGRALRVIYYLRECDSLAYHLWEGIRWTLDDLRAILFVYHTDAAFIHPGYALEKLKKAGNRINWLTTYFEDRLKENNKEEQEDGEIED